MKVTHTNSLYLGLTFLFFAQTGFTQTINDKTFTNVIRIENKDVAMIGNNILIDIPLKREKQNVRVFYNDTSIPSHVFFNSPSFFPELDEFIVIAPDSEYYLSVAQNAGSGDCAKPITTSKLFHIKRANGKIKADSIRIQGNDQFKLNFATSPLLDGDTIKVYYIFCCGSVCCPPDPKWILHIDQKQFITQFENQHDVKIRNTYRQTTGKEGEHCIYFTLGGLSPILKLQFIIDYQYYTALDKKAEKEKNTTQIFVPQIIMKMGKPLIN